MYALAALLVIGFLANTRIATRPSWSPAPTASAATASEAPLPIGRVVATWMVVVVPLAWGIAQVAAKSLVLFR